MQDLAGYEDDLLSKYHGWELPNIFLEENLRKLHIRNVDAAGGLYQG